jgi:hypothetical protein
MLKLLYFAPLHQQQEAKKCAPKILGAQDPWQRRGDQLRNLVPIILLQEIDQQRTRIRVPCQDHGVHAQDSVSCQDHGVHAQGSSVDALEPGQVLRALNSAQETAQESSLVLVSSKSASCTPP